MRGKFDNDKLDKLINEMIYKKGVKDYVINLKNINLNYNDFITIINNYLNIKMNDGRLMICCGNDKKEMFENIKCVENELDVLN